MDIFAHIFAIKRGREWPVRKIQWVVVVRLLVERSFLSTEICGSNPDFSNLIYYHHINNEKCGIFSVIGLSSLVVSTLVITKYNFIISPPSTPTI